MAATAEAIHVAGWLEDETRNTLDLPYPIMREDPLVAAGIKCTPWEPLPSDQAAEAWLNALRGELV